MTLLLDIIDYCRRNETGETAFGKAAVGDVHLVRDLRKGMAIGPAREKWVRQAIDNNPHGFGKARRRGGADYELHKPDADDEGIGSHGAQAVARAAAEAGSRDLLVAMVRLGVKMGGLAGLDAFGFCALCDQFGIKRPTIYRKLAAPG